jgi:hypothetical protein
MKAYLDVGKRRVLLKSPNVTCIVFQALVGIVEFILYGCTNYFMKRHGAASLALQNLALVYGEIITEYNTTSNQWVQ